MHDDDMAKAHRRDALSKALHETLGAWEERFRDEPGFEPDSEMCFCVALKLGCFIATFHDQPTREYLRRGTREALDAAITRSLDLRH